MNAANLPDLIGAIIGFVLTVLVLSYIFGDNALFRLAIHLFIGVSAGYAAVLLVYNVIWFQVIWPLIQAPLERIHLTVPALLLGLWLLSKLSPRFARLGNPVLAFMVGVGAAAAAGGAVLGTVFPQVNAAMDTLDLQAAQQSGVNLVRWLVEGAVVLVGSVSTLAYFHFGARPASEQPSRRLAVIEWTGQIGQVFIAVTFGVMFAGVYAAALVALIERTRFLWNFIWIYMFP